MTITAEQIAAWRARLELHDNGSGLRVGIISHDDVGYLLATVLPTLLDEWAAMQAEIERLRLMHDVDGASMREDRKALANLEDENQRLRALLRAWDAKCQGHCDTEAIAEQVEKVLEGDNNE